MNEIIELSKAEEALKEINQEPTPGSARTVEELERAEANFDPMMAPSGLVGMYLPKFIDLVNGLSNKSLRRLIRALVAFPLEELHPNKNNAEEVAAYQMGDRILQSKYLMILYTAMEHEQKKQQEKLAKEAAEVSDVVDAAQDAAAQEVSVSVPSELIENNGVNNG